jgi:putative endonuclease
MKDYYVYILTNEHNTVLYIGVTNNLQRRVYEHKLEINEGFTKDYQVHKLIYFENCHNIHDAIAREKQLKGWTRKKKEALIATMNPEWKALESD